MKPVRKSAVLLFLTGLLLLLFAVPVSGQDYTDIQYVVFEAQNGSIVRVDYQEAVRLKDDDGQPRLYNDLALYVGQALANYRGVWIRFGADRWVDYKAAVIDNREDDIATIYDDYQIDFADMPVITHELVYDAGQDRVKTVPYQPEDLPRWVDGPFLTWSHLAQKWVADIVIDEGWLSEDTGGYTLNTISSVSIKGVTAIRGTGAQNNRWHALLEGAADNPPEVLDSEVVIRLGHQNWWDF